MTEQVLAFKLGQATGKLAKFLTENQVSPELCEIMALLTECAGYFYQRGEDDADRANRLEGGMHT